MTRRKEVEGNTLFLDRSDWPAGPWDQEPDFHHVTHIDGAPIICYRLFNGAWATLVGYDTRHKDKLLKYQRVSWATNRKGQRRLEFVMFDDQARYSDLMDVDKVYVGFFYIEPNDLAPAHAKYLDIDHKPDQYNPQYVTLAQAETDALHLCDLLQVDGIR